MPANPEMEFPEQVLGSSGALKPRMNTVKVGWGAEWTWAREKWIRRLPGSPPEMRTRMESNSVRFQSDARQAYTSTLPALEDVR